ncbi:ABC transporter substrate-binding protein [Mucilaginibacter sp. AW1-7]|uniref:ABC transporter substrate-binding protein n=1 Tax=Mucilaginibacter sp. AW1-7 TaxID=3349874 RepID=UPI003F733B77
MISVRNHLLQLSGNKWLLFFITALVLAACSPKVRQVAPVKKPTDTEAEKPKIAEKPPVKPAASKPLTIAMVLPLGLDHLKPGARYTSPGLTKANMSVEYYQGFKLALDSLTAGGANFKLRLYDSKDEAAQAHSLGFNPLIKNSDLIVGPVFPDGMKVFAAVLNTKSPVVSPLSPASPATINSDNLITVMPPLEYHGWGAAQYINDKLKPKKIFILRSGFSQEQDYVRGFKNATDSLSNKKVKVIIVTISKGQLGGLIPQLSKKEQNIFVVAATDQAFLTVTLKSLDTLNRHYPVTLFGHPSWEKFSFLKIDILQRLKTHITSGDQVDYKSDANMEFVRVYHRAYHVEPTDFAIKGFDEGMYFGRQLIDNNFATLDKTDYVGLHNRFHFIKKNGLGWVNTHVNVLMYANFELKQVE